MRKDRQIRGMAKVRRQRGSETKGRKRVSERVRDKGGLDRQDRIEKNKKRGKRDSISVRQEECSTVYEMQYACDFTKLSNMIDFDKNSKKIV